MARMSKLRITRTAKFKAVSLAGEIYAVEEYTYLGKDSVNVFNRFQWTPGQKFYMLNSLEAVDPVSGNVYKIRCTGERIMRKS